MKKILFFFTLLILGVAGVGVLYYFMMEKPFAPPKGTVLLRISQETTVVTEPLLPDGSAIDFFAVLDQFAAAGADAENNGFRNIVRLLGRNIYGDISDEKWKILCAKLNLNPDDPPLLHYIPLFDFLCDAIEKEKEKHLVGISPKEQARQISFSFSFRIHEEILPEHLELLERWITEMEPAISAIAESLRQPIYVIPPTGNFDFPDQFALPDMTVFPDFYYGIRVHNEMAQMFTSRYLFRQIKQETESDLSDSWDDVLSLFRIARHFGQQSFPESTNFANAFERNAAFRATELLKTGGFTAEKLRQCLVELDALPTRTKYEERLEYVRLGWLKNISEFPKKGPAVFHCYVIEPIPDHLSEEEKQTFRHLNVETKKLIHIYRTVPFDWNIVAEIMNAEFDDRQGKPTKQTIFQSQPERRKLYEQNTLPEYSLDELKAIVDDGALDWIMKMSNAGANAAWDIVQLQQMSLEERSILLGKTFSKYALKPEWFAHLSREGTTAFEMLKTAIALRLHKVENENYPAALDELVEKGYLLEVPNDPYRRGIPQPLSYRVEPSGSCVLYSVGVNGTADAGLYTGTYSLEGRQGWDDVVIELD